jgi:hypothetical protein
MARSMPDNIRQCFSSLSALLSDLGMKLTAIPDPAPEMAIELFLLAEDEPPLYPQVPYGWLWLPSALDPDAMNNL